MGKETLWEAHLRRNPGHSQWYIDRFAALRAEGADLHGEVRMLDALCPRGARVLDAGCGPGRVGGELARRGHTVVGVDVDPVLVAQARADHPEAVWHVGDLAELALREGGRPDAFDVIVCAGNVMAFLAPGTAREVLSRFRAHLAPGGRAVIGFGSGRGYAFGDFLDDAAAAGLRADATFSTWDLRPLGPDADFLVAVLSPA